MFSLGTIRLFEPENRRDDGNGRSRVINEGVCRTIFSPVCDTRLWGHRNLSSPTLTHLEDAQRKMASAGKIAPRVEMKIVGRDGGDLEVGRIGEIVARGSDHEGVFQRSQSDSQED